MPSSNCIQRFKFLVKMIMSALFLTLITQISYGNPGLIFDKITTRQGLSHSTVYSIAQDAKGFIWIGTREGLNRYDSYGIKTYYCNPEDADGLDSNQITAMLSSRDGTLYIGTSIGLNIYNQDKDLIKNIKYKDEAIGSVNQIFEASDQSMYICSDKGLFVLNKKRQVKQLTTGSRALAINEYKKNVFWLAANENILLINQYGEQIKKYKYLQKAGNPLKTANNTSCIFKDSAGEIWVGTVRNGVYHYIPEKDIFKPIVPTHKDNPIEVNVVRAISEDNQGNLWIGTESGLFIYDKRTRQFSHYTQDFDNSSRALNDKAIYSIYKGQEGIMWIGTYFGGVNFVSPREKGFYKLISDGGEKALSGKAVSQIIEDNKGNLWIGTEDGGISIYDQKNDSFKYFTHLFNNKNSISCDNVHAIHNDGKGNIWIGTFLGGLNKYDMSGQEFTTYKRNANDTASISNNYVYAILKDSRNILWVGTQQGLNIYNYEKENFTQFKPRHFSDKFIYDILEDDQGNLWFCTRNSGIFFYNVKEDRIVWYNKNNNKNHGLSNNKIISAYQDSKKRIWFGSLNGGLIRWDQRNNQFYAVTKQEGLPNNNVYGILEDGHRNLWVSTNKGLSRYNPKTGKIRNFNTSHGLIGNQFNFKSAYKDKNGRMYFGTVNGLCYFHPDSLTFNKVAPSVHFTDLKLFNKSIEVDKKSILTSHIDETNEIKFRYNQNVITFEFIAINYFSPGNNTFSYYMEGFEEGWSIKGNNTTATYTNLSPGEYTFHVKAANNDGVWSGEKQVKLTVMPPLWLSNWAIALYVLIFIFVIYLYRRYLNYRHQEKMAIQIERLEREKITEINQHKINFFTNISHEFKTPLTLIIASIDKFISDKSGSKENNNGYWSIKRNAKRLHFLIDQLMEFRRVEADHATTNFDKGDIVLFLKETFHAFIPIFNRKNIEFHFKASHREFVACFDSDKLEKIITNLISNASKYTPDNGLIEMEVGINSTDSESGTINISISDTGLGIDQKELDRIFNPFYQTGNGKMITNGTGIGLALVKSLVTFLKGQIHIESNLNNGTQVSLTLPLTLKLQQQEVRLIEGNKTLDIEHVLYEEETDFLESNLKDQLSGHPEYKLLIVEDNKEIVRFLTDHFCKSYKIIQADNGRKALEKLEKITPDIILSDIVMPEMNGIEFCHCIKTNINTSHIPLILLTAKTTIESKLKGLGMGADAYISKPFNLLELELSIKNLLESRYQLKKHFMKFGNLKDIEVSLNNRDQDFLLRLTSIVEDHLEDSDFNITAFTQAAAVSRSLLHLKLKKLVNLSASEFIKTIRLNRAEILLQKTDLAVSEIAYKVGYSDPNYFSRTFKERYQVNPTDYRENCTAII